MVNNIVEDIENWEILFTRIFQHIESCQDVPPALKEAVRAAFPEMVSAFKKAKREYGADEKPPVEAGDEIK